MARTLIYGAEAEALAAFLPSAALISDLEDLSDGDLLLLADGALTGPRMRAIAACARARRARVLTLQPQCELDATVRLDRQLRPLRIDDLFRVEWPSCGRRVHEALSGRTILVTGAAGSIGSEICRFAAAHEPAVIVALDVAESGLFELQQEMLRRFPGVAFHPALAAVQDERRMESLIARFRPSLICHAAAYKHVPLLEDEVCQAVRNNVLATWSLCAAAVRAGVERLLFVSTDKAARARNVLGLSKRVAEMAVASVSRASIARSGHAFFAARPGNVLGSSGSVTRAFEAQIRAGLPVTVTDARMERYFTTLSTCSRFLLEVAAMGRGGELYTLDMGAPVRVLDLAQDMIRLRALDPTRGVSEEEARIAITGARPGEELSESLFDSTQSAEPCGPTPVRRIAGCPAPVPYEEMAALMRELESACAAERPARARALLEDAVGGRSAAEIVAVSDDQS